MNIYLEATEVFRLGDTEQSEIQRIIKGEAEPEYSDEKSLINLDKLISVNRGTEPGLLVLWFSHKLTKVIKMEYEEFRSFIVDNYSVISDVKEND